MEKVAILLFAKMATVLQLNADYKINRHYENKMYCYILAVGHFGWGYDSASRNDRNV